MAWIVWICVCALIGIVGIIFGFLVGESRLKKLKQIGSLYVDNQDGEIDIYLGLEESPEHLKDREVVLLQIVKTQEKQAS